MIPMDTHYVTGKRAAGGDNMIDDVRCVRERGAPALGTGQAKQKDMVPVAVLEKSTPLIEGPPRSFAPYVYYERRKEKGPFSRISER